MDIGFKRFLTLRLVSVLWVVALVFVAVSTVAGLVVGAFMATGDGKFALFGLLLAVGSVVGGVFSVLLTRILLEGVAVLFRIADNTSVMAGRQEPARGL